MTTKAESQGEVHHVFLDRVGELADHAKQNATAARQQGQRIWDRPNSWSGKPSDIGGLTSAFDRSEIDENYAALIADGSKPGTSGDAVSVKFQGDYVGIIERGLHARYSSSIRCIAHMTARKKGHGNEKGIFKGGIIKYAEDAIKAGGS